ncbi:MAG TPA: YkvA family protein [Candidatus Cybelea sp.]|nr:YkvA family protein [Candidatus Cybelea sp.]
MRLLRLLFAAKTAIFRTFPLLRDTRVPLSLKLIAAAVGLLVISPVDIFSDIPVLGALDDVALLTLLCMWFVGQAAKHVEPIPVRQRTGNALATR